MLEHKISKKQIAKNFKNVYYCRIVSQGNEFEFWQKRLKEKLGLELLPVRYYNSGVYGWNFTAYPATNGDLFICSFYRNIPSNAQDITEKLTLN